MANRILSWALLLALAANMALPRSSLAQSALLDGDFNCDGLVNNFDIDAFVLAITDPAAFRSRYPGCAIPQAEDHVCIQKDQQALIELLVLNLKSSRIQARKHFASVLIELRKSGNGELTLQRVVRKLGSVARRALSQTIFSVTQIPAQSLECPPILQCVVNDLSAMKTDIVRDLEQALSALKKFSRRTKKAIFASSVASTLKISQQSLRKQLLTSLKALAGVSFIQSECPRR